MKTIEDAVIELGGKLPNPTYRKISNAAGWYISSTGKLTHAVDCVWFNPKEFEACAKRMGYINEQPKDHIVEANEMVGNWHERGELPPVGVECEYRYKHQQDANWRRGKIMYIGTDLFVAFDGHEERAHFVDNAKFRPIKSHREKVIEAACKVQIEIGKSLFESLYNAGMLVLPQDSGDTKD